MKIEELHDYHRRRAMRELDLGLSAKLPQVARAHLALSSLHLERLRQVSGGDGDQSLPLS
jgi:hypothetical protein